MSPEHGPGPGAGADEPDPFSTPYVPLSAEGPVADTSLFLSHHQPEDYDRCAVVAGRHVCRRCLVMYPVALVVGIAWAAVGPWWPESWDEWMIPLLPLPAVIEFVLDNMGAITYSPRRQVAVTALGAVAAGAGYLRYLEDPADPLVWGTVLTYGVICVAASLGGHARRARRGTGADEGAVGSGR